MELFYRFFRPIVEAGHVYAAQPPLFCIKHGKTIKYVLNEDEKAEYLASLPATTKPDVMRMKGLGEMDPKQLWETTLNPETRILKQVEIEDARMATEVTSMLMGSDVPPRRAFIHAHANEAEIDA